MGTQKQSLKSLVGSEDSNFRRLIQSQKSWPLNELPMAGRVGIEPTCTRSKGSCLIRSAISLQNRGDSSRTILLRSNASLPLSHGGKDYCLCGIEPADSGRTVQLPGNPRELVW